MAISEEQIRPMNAYRLKQKEQGMQRLCFDVSADNRQILDNLKEQYTDFNLTEYINSLIEHDNDTRQSES